MKTKIEKLLKEYEEAILDIASLHSRWSHTEIQKRLDKARKALAEARKALAEALAENNQSGDGI